MHSVQNKGVLPERRLGSQTCSSASGGPPRGPEGGSYGQLCVGGARLPAAPAGARQQVVVRVQGALLRRRALFAGVVIFGNAQLFESLGGGEREESDTLCLLVFVVCRSQIRLF